MSENDLHFLNFYYPSDYLEAYHNLQKVRWGDEYSSYSFEKWFDIPVGSRQYTAFKNLEKTIVELGFEYDKRVKKIFAEHSSKVVKYLENIENGIPKYSDRL